MTVSVTRFLNRHHVHITRTSLGFLGERHKHHSTHNITETLRENSKRRDSQKGYVEAIMRSMEDSAPWRTWKREEAFRRRSNCRGVRTVFRVTMFKRNPASLTFACTGKEHMAELYQFIPHISVNLYHRASAAVTNQRQAFLIGAYRMLVDMTGPQTSDR